MNKLTALKTLANAYWHLMNLSQERWLVTDFDATEILNRRFGYIRRSMDIEDLKPEKQDAVHDCRYKAVVEWIVSQGSFLFAECSLAEEIITRCKDALGAK